MRDKIILFIRESDIGDVNELGLLFKKSSTTKYKYLNGLISTIPSDVSCLSIVYSGSRKPRHHPNFDRKLYLSNVPSSSTFHFNVTGECFDYGPWRFLEFAEPNFTAAYFDYNQRYSFSKQLLTK